MKQQFLEKTTAFRFKRFTRKSYAAFASLREVTIGVVMAFVLTLSVVGDASAQSNAADTTALQTEHQLEEVNVTASRVGMPVSQSAKLLHVISKEEIRSAPVQSIQDLLKYIPGVDLLQRGGHGVQADVSIRGGSFDQTAVLLNGVNLSNPQTGHYSFDLPVNLNDIERIEILYGPSSFIYGAGALSGAINIITKKTPDHKVYGKLQAGSHRLAGAEGGFVLKPGASTHQLSLSYNQSDGYIANSDYKLRNALWQSRLPVEGSTLDIQLGYNGKSYGANTFYSPKYPNQYDDTESYLASVKWQTGTKLKFTPVIYWNRHDDCFQLIRGDESKVKYNYHQTNVYGTNLDFQYTSGLGTTAFGTEIRSEGVLSSVLGNPMDEPKGKYSRSYDRTNISYLLEHTLKLQKFTLTGGIMANYNTEFQDDYKFYPTAGVAFNPNSSWKVYTSWSKATRMPTFTDLYYNTPTHTGNTGLKPEESSSFNLGVDFSHRLFGFYLSGHLTDGKNIIDWLWEDAIGKWKSYNHASIRKEGVEAGVKFQLSELGAFLFPNTFVEINYARLHQGGDQISTGQSSHYVLNYLRDKLTARLSLPIYKDKLTSNWNFRWQKRMGAYDDYSQGATAVRTPFPSFSTLDMRLEYKATEALRVNLDINNLYDTRYFDLGSIPQAGFWLIGGISYTFK